VCDTNGDARDVARRPGVEVGKLGVVVVEEPDMEEQWTEVLRYLMQLGRDA